MSEMVQPGYYRHFKGNKYYVLGVSTHSETQAKEVVYHPVGCPDKLWHRPLEMFTEQVSDELMRFEYLGPNNVGD